MTLDLTVRNKGIGASEAAAVLGLNPYVSPLDIYLLKRGEVEPFKGNEHTRMGKRLEGPLIAEYAERTGQSVTPMFDETVFSKKTPHIFASPDAIVVGKPKLVEAKAVGSRSAHEWGDDGTDHVPERHLVQTAMQMYVMDYESDDVAALIGGNEFRIYPVQRDRELEETILDRLSKFWRDNVQGGVMPAIEDTEPTRAWIKSKFPRNVELLRPATDEESDLMMSLKSARAMKETLEKKEAELKLQLQYLIAESEGIAGDGFKATWKLDSGKKEYVVKAQEPKRVFRPSWS